MGANQQGIYLETWADWFMLRRHFRFETDNNGEYIRRVLSDFSVPPPLDGNPLRVTTPVAITATVNEVILFEINTARGLPVQEGHYISFQLVGRASETDDGHWVISGEVHPLRQGVIVYMTVLVALLLWVAAAVTSAAVSPITSYVAVFVAVGTTLILCGYMLWLQWSDMRRLLRVVRAAADV